MSELYNYIRKTFGVDEGEAALVAAHFEELELRKGDYFLKLGHRCDRLVFVDEGLLRLYAYRGDKEITQWIASKGYFVTDLQGFMFSKPSRWNIRVLADCKLYSINKRNYDQLSTAVADWGKVEKEFLVHCFTTIEDRIFSHLSMSAEERYQWLFATTPQLFNSVSLHYIASMLGMSPETLSRIRAKRKS